jgi:hypothetical protein
VLSRLRVRLDPAVAPDDAVFARLAAAVDELHDRGLVTSLLPYPAGIGASAVRPQGSA